MLKRIEEVVRKEEPFDPACERVDTAIKAMWLLYRRGKAGLIAERMHVPKREIEDKFLAFDLRYIQSERGRITSEKQVFNLIRMFNETEVVEIDGRRQVRTHNPLLVAAMHLVVEYQWIKR